MLKRCWSLLFPQQGEKQANSNNGRKRPFLEILSPGKTVDEDGPPKKRVRVVERYKRVEYFTPNLKEKKIMPKALRLNFDSEVDPKEEKKNEDQDLEELKGLVEPKGAVAEKTEESGDMDGKKTECKSDVVVAGCSEVDNNDETVKDKTAKEEAFTDETAEDETVEAESVKNDETAADETAKKAKTAEDKAATNDAPAEDKVSNNDETAKDETAEGDETNAEDTLPPEVFSKGSPDTDDASDSGLAEASPAPRKLHSDSADVTKNQTIEGEDFDQSKDSTFPAVPEDMFYKPTPARVYFNDVTTIHQLSPYSNATSDMSSMQSSVQDVTKIIESESVYVEAVSQCDENSSVANVTANKEESVYCDATVGRDSTGRDEAIDVDASVYCDATIGSSSNLIGGDEAFDVDASVYCDVASKLSSSAIEEANDTVTSIFGDSTAADLESSVDVKVPEESERSKEEEDPVPRVLSVGGEKEGTVSCDTAPTPVDVAVQDIPKDQVLQVEIGNGQDIQVVNGEVTLYVDVTETQECQEDVEAAESEASVYLDTESGPRGSASTLDSTISSETSRYLYETINSEDEFSDDMTDESEISVTSEDVSKASAHDRFSIAGGSNASVYMDTTQTPSQYSGVGENPFESEKVIKAFLSNLDTNQLLFCRLLNKTWKDIADSILPKRTSLVIRFIKAHESALRFLRAFPLERVHDLCDQLGESGGGFVCHNFEFYGLNLEELCFQKFLYSFGPAVKHLKLGLREDTSCRMWDLLRRSLPNLEEIVLVTVPPSWRSCSAKCGHDWSDRPFPKLKSVSFMDDFSQFLLSKKCSLSIPIVEDLLENIPKMKELEILPETQPPDLSEDLNSSVKVVETLTLELNYKNPHLLKVDLKRLASLGNIATQHLKTSARGLSSFPRFWDEATAILSKILELSSASLLSWETSSLGFLKSLEVPVLQNLHTLKFYLNAEVEGSNQSALPISIDIEQVFPKLTTVGILFGTASLQKYFPQALYRPAGFSTVTTLQCNIVHATDLSNLAEIFPNVRHLDVTLKLGQLIELVPWVFNHYRLLEMIKLYVEEDDYRYCFPIMDEVITGIPEHQCQWLRSRNCTVAPSLAQTLRSDVSILNLQSLKQIDFIFQSRRAYDEHIRINPFITSVASVYGFTMIPGLRGNYYCRKS